MASTFNLPRINQALVDAKGQATKGFYDFFRAFANNVQSNIQDLTDLINAITVIQSQLNNNFNVTVARQQVVLDMSQQVAALNKRISAIEANTEAILAAANRIEGLHVEKRLRDLEICASAHMVN